MRKADEEVDHPEGAFAWRPSGTWGIGQEVDEPEVILVDAGAGTIGQTGRRPGPGQGARGRPRRAKEMMNLDGRAAPLDSCRRCSVGRRGSSGGCGGRLRS